MSCERFHEALTDFAAGGPAEAGLEAHLGRCSSCTRELAARRAALDAADAELAELARAEPSPEFVARLRLQAGEQQGRLSAASGSWAWLAVAAALLLAVAGAVWLESPRRPFGGPVALATPAATASAAPLTSAARDRPAEALPRGAAPASSTAIAHAAAVAGSVAGANSVSVSPGRPAVLRARPEVIVSPGQERALVEYVALVRAQHASPDALQAVGLLSLDTPPKPLEVAPLEIAPLDPEDAQGL